MYIKNNRIIINEDSLITDIEELEQKISIFFNTDPRFSMNHISVSVKIEETQYSNKMWYELNIIVQNHDKRNNTIICITYDTESVMPCLVMNNNVPEFYYVFDYSSSTITNSQTWQNNENITTIEDIILNEAFKDYQV